MASSPSKDGPLYFGASRPGGELFGWYHASRTTLRGGVVLCNPIGDDAVRAHRPLQKLAEQLALAGFAVLRFDFFGTGDSVGEIGRVSTWLEDVELAVAELRRLESPSRIALVGLRLGATLAARVPCDDLVMWGGYTKGAAFLKATRTAYKLHKMLEPGSFAGGPPTRPDGEEAFGFLFSQECLAELETLNLDDAPKPKRVLLLNDGSGRAEQTALESHFGATTQVIPQCLQFLVEAPHRSRLPEGALTAITSFLVSG